MARKRRSEVVVVVMMVVVGRGTNEGGGWRVVKDQNRSALGGHSPVITTIGYGECTHRSLLNPCQDVHGGPSRRRGPRWVAGNGSREGCVSGTTTWLPRSADGSLTFLLGRFAQSVDAPAESHLHGRQLKACMDMGGAGWGALSEAAPSPPVFRTVDEPGCANEIWSRFCALLHHCFAAAQANFQFKHSTSRRPRSSPVCACVRPRNCLFGPVRHLVTRNEGREVIFTQARVLPPAAAR
jgi:hypothetical protein